jgi:hypothetical protein
VLIFPSMADACRSGLGQRISALAAIICQAIVYH